MRFLIAGVLWLITTLASLPAGALEVPPWLYTVELSVSDQSAAERQRVSEQALLAVLTRLTGLTSIPRTAGIRSALARPSEYYNEYLYVAREGRQGDETLLRIAFQREALLELMRANRLPVWWTKRPRVMVWLGVEEAGERSILAANSTHPLKDALLAEAERRGIELRLPLMDLDDHLKIGPEAVWGRVSHTMEEAAARYETDMILSGRISSNLTFRGLELKGDWIFWHDGRRIELPVQADRHAALVAQGMDAMVAELLEDYRILAHDPQRWMLRVSGMREVSHYAELMRYVNGLDFVDDVLVTEAEGDVLTLVMTSPAGSDQFIKLLTMEDRLVNDDLFRGIGVQLLWRG